MNNIRALFLVFLYLVAMLRPMQPYIEYVINQEFIINYLCVNKNKPKLECQGKCYLKKQIEKQNETHSNSNKTARVLFENYPIGFVVIFKLITNPTILLQKKHTFFYSDFYDYKYCYSKFIPPNYC